MKQFLSMLRSERGQFEPYVGWIFAIFFVLVVFILVLKLLDHI